MMADPLISESILRQLTAALLLYCLAKLEHRESAISNLKEMVVLSHSHGVISDEEMDGYFRLEGMRGA